MSLYKEAYNIVQEFWDNPVVKSNWRSPLLLIEKMGWELIPYNRFSNILAVKSGEAYAKYKDNCFYILLNVDVPYNRITYNLHHEIGHIVGAHPLRYENELHMSSKNWSRKKLEIEATIIGRNIFLPAQLIDSMLKLPFVDEVTFKKYLMAAYYLSRDYVDTRFLKLKDDLENIEFSDDFFQEEIEFEIKNYIDFIVGLDYRKFGGFYEFLECY